MAHQFAYAVVLSGDCDLEQDYREREVLRSEIEQFKALPPGDKKNEAWLALEPKTVKLLRNTLLCPASKAEKAKVENKLKGALWDDVVDNKHERFYYLSEAVTNEDLQREGVPALLLDFRKIFTVPTEELYAQITANIARRRCFLTPPYLQDLCFRFAFSIARPGLPKPHWELSGLDKEDKITSLVDSAHDALTVEEVKIKLGF